MTKSDFSQNEGLFSKGSLLNVVLQATTDGILVVDVEGNVLLANDKFNELWRIPESIIKLKSDEKLLEFVLDQVSSSEFFISKVEELYNSRESSVDIIHFKDERVFERFSNPLIEENKLIGRVWSFRDISKRIEAEKKLLRLNNVLEQRIQERTNKLLVSEEKFRKLTELSPVAICIQNTEKILFTNPAWSKITGYSIDEALKMSLLDIIHPDMKDLAKERLISRIKGEDVPNRYDLKVKTKTGDTIWADVSVAIIDFESEVASLAVARDITEIKRTQEALRESEEKFKSMFYDGSSIMMLVDPKNGEIVDVNQAASKYYKYSVEEFKKINIDKINTLSYDEIQKEMVKALNQKREHFFFKHRLADEEVRDVEVYSSRILVGERELLFSIIHDITDRKKAEEALLSSEKELRFLNAQKDRFFSIISHDLRSPVGNFLQISELLKNEYKSMPQETLEMFIDAIYNLSSSTFKLLENLLMWARSQTGNLEVKPEGFNLLSLINESVVLVADLASEKEISIINKVPNSLYAFSDKVAILTVLRNLVTNSVKFTPRGGVITFDATERINAIGNKVLQVSVADTGVGISKEKIENLFDIDHSFTTPGTEDEKGTGLGLALCQELVKINGGEIWVESEEGKGSKFTFTLNLGPSF